MDADGRRRGLALVGGLWYYLATGRYVSTDDSSVQAGQASISASVPGRVIELLVHDNQLVHRGDVLFRLDDRLFRIAVEEAQAKLASARMEISAAKATYRQQLSDQAAARDTLAYQQHEYERQQRLLQSGISSRAQFEQVQHALQLAQSQLNSPRSSRPAACWRCSAAIRTCRSSSIRWSCRRRRHSIGRSRPLLYRDPRARRRRRGRVEQLQVGDYINAATPVFGLVSSSDVWVEANFKEDDLTYMRPGQSAEMRIDAYPGRGFKARVASLSPGTGAQFSLLPPENATGNWVKVVQRVPVRLQLDAAEFSTARRCMRA
jgi:membrane fusion protein (multidrug efflux system)